MKQSNPNLRIIKLPILVFLLNFFWESVHSIYLYADHEVGGIHINSLSDYLMMVAYASLGDVILVSIMFVLVAVIYKKLFWKMSQKNLITFSIAGFVLAILIETRALIQGRWAYNQFMPTLFGIGLSPLVQLTITGLIALYLGGFNTLGGNNEPRKK